MHDVVVAYDRAHAYADPHDADVVHEEVDGEWRTFPPRENVGAAERSSFGLGGDGEVLEVRGLEHFRDRSAFALDRDALYAKYGDDARNPLAVLDAISTALHAPARQQQSFSGGRRFEAEAYCLLSRAFAAARSRRGFPTSISASALGTTIRKATPDPRPRRRARPARCFVP